MAKSKVATGFDENGNDIFETDFSNDPDTGGADTEDGEGLVVDLSETGDGAYAIIPKCLLGAVVDEVTFSYSPRSNNPMWSWKFEIEEGEFKGRKLFYHTVFNEGGMPRVKKTLARIKSEDPAVAALLNTKFSPAKVAEEGILTGARCRLRIDKRKYEGEWRNEVKDVLAPAEDNGFNV
jgi:hypothetical protein